MDGSVGCSKQPKVWIYGVSRSYIRVSGVGSTVVCQQLFSIVYYTVHVLCRDSEFMSSSFVLSCCIEMPLSLPRNCKYMCCGRYSGVFFAQ